MKNQSIFSADWTNVVAKGRNEIVFEEKNQNYGAYIIRKEYNRTVVVALAISVSTFLFFISLPKIIEFFSKSEEAVVTGHTEVQIDLTEPPPIDESEPPPPPPPPPPVLETIKFTPPVVVDEVIEEIPPIQEKLSESNVAEVTQEGSGDEEIIIPEDVGKGVVEAEEPIFTIVEQMPEFPGGDEAMYKFINANLRYPQNEKEEGISGKVNLKFKVDKEGNISDFEVQRGIKGYPAFENEAIRVIKKMPKWNPGKQNGRAVSCWFGVPVGFTIR